LLVGGGFGREQDDAFPERSSSTVTCGVFLALGRCSPHLSWVAVARRHGRHPRFAPPELVLAVKKK
jgi:hypothetical protein